MQKGNRQCGLPNVQSRVGEFASTFQFGNSERNGLPGGGASCSLVPERSAGRALPDTFQKMLASPIVNELAILDAFQLIHTPWLDALVAAYTSTSNVGQIWILLGIVLAIIPKTRKLGAAVLIAVLLGAIVTSGLLKPLIMRPRPCDVNPLVPMIVDRPHGSSFPSGHATAAFAAFGALLFSKGPKPLVIVVGIGAVLMALTRLYCYVHYPTDVLAGTVVGLLAGFAAAKIVEAASRKLQERRSQSHT